MLKNSSAAAFGLAFLLPLAAGAVDPPSSTEAKPPTVSVTNSGLTSGYAIRFSGPVDHAFSRLLIVQDGRVLQTMSARLESAPNVLFARSKALPPGTYDLHWITKSMIDGATSEGDSTFTVEPQPH